MFTEIATCQSASRNIANKARLWRGFSCAFGASGRPIRKISGSRINSNDNPVATSESAVCTNRSGLPRQRSSANSAASATSVPIFAPVIVAAELPWRRSTAISSAAPITSSTISARGAYGMSCGPARKKIRSRRRASGCVQIVTGGLRSNGRGPRVQCREQTSKDGLDRADAVHLREQSAPRVVIRYRRGLLRVHFQSAPHRIGIVVRATLGLEADFRALDDVRIRHVQLQHRVQRLADEL